MPEAGRHGDRRNLEAVEARVDIDRADREALRMVDGIGDARTDQIITCRDRHGFSETVDDLQHLPLFEPDVLEQVRGRLTA